MRNTYGIFLEDCNGKLLVATPTGGRTGSLTIPKGGKEVGESDWQAAVREFKEEAGIDVESFYNYTEFIYKLPPVKYRSGAKTLHAYYIQLACVIDIASCTCTTFTKTGQPEVYNHKLVKPEHAMRFLHESQVRAYRNYKLIEDFLRLNNVTI
jgi:8-oxo-dGTP pyrophosphatase MutT (NUDIX family)